jgi:glucose-1-phosphate thymidylyltransferase
MKAIVPAAGRGTRLRPLTDDRPKGLVEVGGRPILTHCFERLLETGVEELVVVVGYRKEMLLEEYGDDFRGVPIRYVHQREPRGLAHAVGLAGPHVEEDCVVLNGDNVFGTPITPALERQHRPDVDATILVEEASRTVAKTTGVVATDDRGRVVDLVEKPDDPSSRTVTTGCYVVPGEIFEACRLVRPSERGEYELTDAIAVLVAAGLTVEAVELEGWRVNVNTPEDRDRAERMLRDG